ncbi:MAG: winged helix-turn-helix domain-containing protein [Acidobacteriota bacterium]|nr:winged helix-turn-helix domain-containing protein [Acidobacteriota bacterium]
MRSGMFEIDPDAGEVLKEGRVVPVQELPFRVLMLLLERPGKVVTREELRARIWPDGTFVSFDEGLNTAIRKLRVALGDSAESPRYIETIPKRGYRFIAPVSVQGEEPKALTEPTVEATPNTPTGSAATVVETQSGTGRRTGHLSWKFLTVAGTAVVLMLVLLIVHSRQTSKPSVKLQQGATKRAMLAVLPFQNLSGNDSQEYFSDGLTEETITDLGQLNPAQLGVIARTSAMAYKHTDKTIAQIGHELGVDYVLEGSVRRENGRARISAQLIRVADQTHLWARNYDAETSSDFLDVQNEIGRAIAEQVRTEITPQYQRAITASHTRNPQAYDLYLRGRFYWNQRTPASIAQSIDVLRQAIDADPKFAPAYAALADAYNIGNILGLYSSEASLPEAKRAAEKAIALDPTLADAHAALGMALSHYDFDFAGAKREFLKALELNPNSAYAHLFYSNCYLLPMGQRAEAIAENKKAVELDPLSLPINNFLGMTYLYAKDYAASERQFRSTIAMDPSFSLPHAYIGFLYEIQGRYSEAIDEEERADELAGMKTEQVSARAERLKLAFKREGVKGYWRERLVLDEQEMRTSPAGVSPVNMALDASMAGLKPTALAWLSKSYEAREGSELTLLAVDPAWDNLREDPQFKALLARIGLPNNLN